MSNNKSLTIQQYQDLTGLSRSSINRHIKSGKLKSVKRVNRRRIIIENSNLDENSVLEKNQLAHMRQFNEVYKLQIRSLEHRLDKQDLVIEELTSSLKRQQQLHANETNKVTLLETRLEQTKTEKVSLWGKFKSRLSK